MRPHRTVRFADRSAPDYNESAETRLFELQRRWRKAWNRALREQTWVVENLRKDGTCPAERGLTKEGWRTKNTDDLQQHLVSDPLLGTQTFDEQLKFAKPRYTNEQLNRDWKRAVLIALNLFREVWVVKLRIKPIKIIFIIVIIIVQ